VQTLATSFVIVLFIIIMGVGELIELLQIVELQLHFVFEIL
jgi:hypothetical protein